MDCGVPRMYWVISLVSNLLSAISYKNGNYFQVSKFRFVIFELALYGYDESFN
jgi:hypothetical protein